MYVCSCICIQVWWYLCMCAGTCDYMCTCICAWKPEINFKFFSSKLSILIFGKVSCCNLGLADLTRLVGWKASGMPWLLLPSTSSQQHTQMFIWRLGIEFRSPCTLLTELSPQALVLCFYGRLVTGESIEFRVLLSCIWSRQLLLWLSFPKSMVFSSMLPRMETD